MIKSMTGFGKGEAESEGRRFLVEIRSVNNRYCDVGVRLPRRYSSLEGEIKKALSATVSRGKLDVTLTAEGSVGTAPGLEVNMPLAESYFSALCSLREKLGIEGEITVRDISSIPDVLRLKEESLDVKRDWPFILESINRAVDALNDMKKAEGDALASDIFGRLEKIVSSIDDVNKRAPSVIESYKERLAERIRGMGYEPDKGLLAQEVASFADRCDISEEIVRLRSHLGQFKAIAVSHEPGGRKLDFLLQEINREVNTIGSKGNDADISQKVVDMKAELEKIREQVQNIE